MPDAPTQPIGRRERKKQATRDRLYDCALRLFATRGYDATSMEDIGDCADVSRATVFNYFRRKEDIISEWTGRRRVKAAEILADEQHPDVDTPSRLHAALGRLADLYVGDPVEGRALVRAWLSAGGPLLPDAAATATLFAATLRAGQERGDIRPDVDTDVVGHLLLDAYLGAIYRWVAQADDAKATLHDDLAALLDVTLTGITGVTDPTLSKSRR
jgi:AcrR family transcriptional regulator